MAALALAGLVTLAVCSAALELWRAGQFYARSDRGQRFLDRQARFREARRLLPRHGVVGYLSDRPDAVATYFLAQYALAPLVLERGGPGRWSSGTSSSRSAPTRSPPAWVWCSSAISARA